ncbi:hypothetical protein V6O07_10025, partial [Arthrospira platensis SPKY2]
DVCVVASNNCGESPEFCFNVVANPAPNAVISGGGSYCAGTPEDFTITVTLTGVAPWELTYEHDGGNPVTVTVNSSPYVFTVSEAGTYEITELNDGGSCPGTFSG